MQAARRGWCRRLSQAAIAAGADGLLVEMHPSRATPWCDADQR